MWQYKKFGKMFWNRSIIVYEEGEEFSRIEESKLSEVYCINCGASTEDGLIIDVNRNNEIVRFLG